MNILQALDDPQLLGASLRDPASWSAWRAFQAALFALPMSEDQLALYRACTGRSAPPAKPFSEAWMICGRRAGKSWMMATTAVYLAAFRRYDDFLAPGERATIMVIAADRKQARVIMRYVRGHLATPILAQLVERETADAFDLTNRITIEVTTASHRAVRGYTLAAALADEVAFWPSEDSATPDYEILDALRPAMGTIPGAILLCASSPYARRGAMWDAFRRYHGVEDAPALVWRAATRTMNPSFSQAIIDEACERDPASAASEYLAEFRSDIASFMSREMIDAAIVPGRFEIPAVPGVRYFGFTDPSGGSSDAMTLAIAHKEGEAAILDCVAVVTPPFSPDSVVKDFCDTLRRYRLFSVTGDRYGGEWPRERFRAHGVTYELADKAKSEIYKEALPLFAGKRVEIIDHKRLASELAGLERRTARGGRDSIDHRPGAHDDVANAVCGALTACSAAAKNTITVHPFPF